MGIIKHRKRWRAWQVTAPFAITNHMVKLVSEIAEKIGRLDRYQSIDAKPCLRRNNRIRSFHSSLAIEANSLSDELGKFDPFSIDELKRLRGVMTYLTVDESGQFRRGEEGVFDGGRCIFMAPPAMRVSALMDDLFSWMKQARKDVHPLILSSVFIMSLCSSTRLRMGTDAWRGFGRQACSASGTAFFNICR